VRCVEALALRGPLASLAPIRAPLAEAAGDHWSTKRQRKSLLAMLLQTVMMGRDLQIARAATRRKTVEKLMMIPGRGKNKISTCFIHVVQQFVQGELGVFACFNVNCSLLAVIWYLDGP
jgi:hypothetical protein